MKQYRYVKSDAFTSGDSLGNPASCIFTGQEDLSPEQMQAIAAEHKGFVMEVVFCGQSEVADCKLTYYSSECEVEFCGHSSMAMGCWDEYLCGIYGKSYMEPPDARWIKNHGIEAWYSDTCKSGGV